MEEALRTSYDPPMEYNNLSKNTCKDHSVLSTDDEVLDSICEVTDVVELLNKQGSWKKKGKISSTISIEVTDKRKVARKRK
jgi:hypothetical protein